MASKDRKSRLGARDSITGQFIPLKEADRRPRTTQREHIPLPGRGDAPKKSGGSRKRGN